MASRRRRHRRHLRVPRRPRLGPGRPLRSGARPAGPHLHPPGRFSAPGTVLRRGLLRHLPPGGRGDGPPAAAAAGGGLGGRGTGRDQARTAAGLRHRRLHGPGRAVVPRPRRTRRRSGRLCDDRRRTGARLGAYRLCPRAARTGADGRHRLLRLPHRNPSGLPCAAPRRDLPGPGRRGDRPRDTGRLPGLLGPARTGTGRPLQVVRGLRRRYGVGRRRRTGAAGAAVRRTGPGPPRPRRHPRHRRQLRRRVQRAHRAERPRAAAGDPAGPGGRRAHRGGRRRRGGPRHRYPAGRPHRGQRAHRGLRRGTAARPAPAARLAEIGDRTRFGRRRGRRTDQNGDGTPARCAARDPARGPPDIGRRLDGGGRRTAHRIPSLAPGRPPAPGRNLLLRHQRHQRPSDPGGGARGTRAGRPGRPSRPCGTPAALPGLRPGRAGAARSGPGAARRGTGPGRRGPRGTGRGPRPVRRARRRARRDPDADGVPCRRRRPRPERPADRAGRAGR